MSVIRAADSRRSETPSGVMTTFASPTQGGASCALWRVDAKPGVAGPQHDIDTEQVWSWLAGGATVELGDERFAVGVGDTVVMPAHVLRRVVADEHAGFTAVVTAAGGARALMPDGTDVGTPPWIA
ncbi:cupin domain-containing protein [Nonomuraea sp. NPDC050227]|uniref:cupin domain-containing protein n=1 Tax=Nonomuraea sp. NPDC050227 TaxID=3364360 RepID=UPI00379F992F